MSDTQSKAIFEVLSEAMVAQQTAPDEASQAHARAALVEAFDQVRAIVLRDDRGWERIRGGGEEIQNGLTLADLKLWSPKIRESIVGAPWMGQGFRLRHSYVSEHGIRYGNVPKTGTKGKRNVKNLIDDPLNQLHFFSKEARRKRELRLYADGIALWMGDDDTRKIVSIPLSQITDQILDPDGLGIVWAYKREWSERDLVTGVVEEQKEWIFTDRFTDKRVPVIKETTGGTNPTDTKVSQTKRIFDMHANPMDGMPYGSPDALAAYIWLQIARGAVMDGVAMQKALATFAFKATVKTSAAGTAAAMALATPQGAGQTAVLGGPNDLNVLSNAGRGYDFSSLVPLVSMVAASLAVSVIALTSDSGNAGSSYGSAQTLELPVRLAMEARRDEHIDLDKRVLVWMGLENPDVGYVPFAAGQETYRAAQSIMLGLTADVYTRQEVRDQLDDLFGRPNGTVPTEDKRPSVLAAKAMAKAVPKPEPAAPAADGSPDTSTASPNQGKSNGTGGQSGAANDLRDDS